MDFEPPGDAGNASQLLIGQLPEIFLHTSMQQGRNMYRL
jgi:hypothetical protein